METCFGYWVIGTHFLQLSENACNELVATSNRHFVVSDQPIDPAEYSELVKWSDHTVGVAVLFDFFHGIEVVLKGFISLGKQSVPKTHRITALLGHFEEVYGENAVGRLIGGWTRNLDEESPLGRFFQSNGIDVDNWYEALKYPELRAGQTIDHFHLKYAGPDGAEFWRALGQAARDIRVEAVRLARAFEH